MLAHATSASSSKAADGFTVNTKVTTDDVYGNTMSSTTTSGCGSILPDVAKGGKGIDWPTKALLFVVNR